MRLYEGMIPAVSVTLTGTYEDGVIRLDGPSDWATNLERYLHGPLAADE